MPLIIRQHVVYGPKSSVPKPPSSTTNGSAIPRTCKPWTEQDDALVRKTYDPFNVEPLATKLGRTTKAVTSRASILGVATSSRAEVARRMLRKRYAR